MHKQRQALLIATLAGLLIVGAAAFAVQPNAGADIRQPALQLSAASPLAAPSFARPT